MRHAQYLRDAEGVRKLMRAHREILAPKFAVVNEVLTHRLGGRGVASWTHPTGGYFITLDVMDGTASRVAALAKEAGIALTPAGASHPHDSSGPVVSWHGRAACGHGGCVDLRLARS